MSIMAQEIIIYTEIFLIGRWAFLRPSWQLYITRCTRSGTPARAF